MQESEETSQRTKSEKLLHKIKLNIGVLFETYYQRFYWCCL